MASEKLTAEEQRIAQKLKEHQATRHGHPPIPKTSTPEPSQNIEEKIRCRAHDLYVQRGCHHGHDLDDWLRAEAEIRTKNAKTTAA